MGGQGWNLGLLGVMTSSPLPIFVSQDMAQAPDPLYFGGITPPQLRLPYHLSIVLPLHRPNDHQIMK